MTVSAVPRRIAYLTGEYPKASHTFILREAEALRAQGFEVVTCSVRRVGAEQIIGPEEEAAQASTFYVLAAAKSPVRLVRDHLGALIRGPGRYFGTLALAWRTARPGAKGRLWSLFYFAEAGVLAAELRRRGAQHLHNHFADSSANVAMLAAGLADIPFSYTLHGPAELFEPESWHLATKTARARFVACISHFCRSQAMLFSDPADWPKLRIVHCGVTPGMYDRPRPAPGRGLRLIFVGRLAAIKGLNVLMDAFDRASRTAPDLTLTLVGDGDARAALEAAAAPLGGRVRFTGYLSQDAVARELAGADAFVLPSFAEGVPVVLMEAMATGLPVISSRLAGIPELIEHGESGYLVPPGDAEGLARTILDLAALPPEARAAMGAAGRARVAAEFDVRREADWLGALIRGTAGSGLRPDAGGAAPADLRAIRLMCGLAGFLWGEGARLDEDPAARVRVMADTIVHRGPDSAGVWADRDAGIALGHRRLAIVDLSEAGHQPMISPSGRYVLAYNGEIYNHADLRAELTAVNPAPAWRGHSDTETLNAGFDAWGIEATLTRAVGMFAIAVWDRETRRLALARDRMGEKPMLYGWQGRGARRAFLFGSELRALAAHPSCTREVDRTALVHMMRHGHVGERLAIYEGVRRLPPGALVEVSAETPEPEPRFYWDGAAVSAARARPLTPPATPEAAVDRLEELLLDATGRQMMSDVPLGAFLSGGVDSSAVVALMQRLSERPVMTFSIGFHEKRYDEAGFARAVAAHLGTEHTELYVGPSELTDVVPKLASIYDEPFADSSQIPTFLVSELARRHVTVALSGDGGDELFHGYDRYDQGARLAARFGRVPGVLRRAAAGAVRAVPAGVWDRILDPVRAVPEGKEHNGQRLHRLADYLAAPDRDALHRLLVSRWRDPEAAIRGGREAPGLLAGRLPPAGDLDDAERMMQLDALTYLPDDILAKVDRASMAVSLECRAPMLDHRVVEYAWSLPKACKWRDGQSKWALRQVLYRHVPRALIERPKMGFEVPIGLWLRGPLRDWAEALLARSRLDAEGWFDPATVRTMWEDHLACRINAGLQLWPVLMVQAWRAHALALPVPPVQERAHAGR